MNEFGDAAQELARLLVQADPRRRDPSRRPSDPMSRRKGTVVAVSTGGTATVNVGGVDVAGVWLHRHVTPRIGEEVWVEFANGSPQVAGSVGPPVWTPLTLLNGASSVGSPFANPGYAALPGNRVGLRGQVTLGSGGVGASLFQLPTELQPLDDLRIHVAAYTGSAWASGILYVNRRSAGTNPGHVTPAQATNSQPVALDGVSFSIF